jgi:glycosyltransferase involved in cell wall biosynthesis
LGVCLENCFASPFASMTPNRVVLLTGNPLRSNPRVVKEAGALAEAGFDVRVLGAWSPERGVEADMRVAASGGYAFRPLLRSDSPFGALHLVLQRAARQCAPRSSLTFGLMPVILEREAIRLRPHLAIAHSEPALFAALALHKRGVKVGVDMEDWFSEDLPTDARRGRPVELLRKSERELLRCAAHATCTSEVMADALARAYGCARPTRIYNVFPKPVLPDQLVLRDRSPASKSLDGAASRGRAVRSIHWFSQTIGPGRGLEDLFAAAESLPEECEIHLRGNPGGYRRWIESAVPLALRSRVFVHAPVPNDELPERIAEHDIGFAGETTAIRSRDLTATNKIFQYLQSGLAVVASDTTGQKEVAALASGAVVLYACGEVTPLRSCLAGLVSSVTSLELAQANALRIGADDVNWKSEKQRLLDVFQSALGR